MIQGNNSILTPCVSIIILLISRYFYKKLGDSQSNNLEWRLLALAEKTKLSTQADLIIYLNKRKNWRRNEWRQFILLRFKPAFWLDVVFPPHFSVIHFPPLPSLANLSLTPPDSCNVMKQSSVNCVCHGFAPRTTCRGAAPTLAAGQPQLIHSSGAPREKHAQTLAARGFHLAFWQRIMRKEAVTGHVEKKRNKRNKPCLNLYRPHGL